VVIVMFGKKKTKKNRKHKRSRRNRFGLLRKVMPLLVICMSIVFGGAAAVGAVVLAEKVFG
jgi:hypothetical protein